MALEHSREERTARLLPEELHLFDLKGTLQRLRSEPEYAENGRNGTTLVKNAELRVVLEALREGADMAEHRAPGPITVQVLEGEIRFSVGEAVHTLRPGRTAGPADMQTPRRQGRAGLRLPDYHCPLWPNRGISEGTGDAMSPKRPTFDVSSAFNVVAAAASNDGLAARMQASRSLDWLLYRWNDRLIVRSNEANHVQTASSTD